ncbi:SLC13 family permease [Pseudoalteromonas sp. BDTF-M6]|uniref:SLC13 family permease n=1 Tax=Pseudoalteromonas sp. BDTF-M6 TaxID=2796132 RepID=UPI001BAEA579|nr:SLC13 family permease [Pseudoalteromonas sp. BDTF-M6]MBS3797155.1 SLC13 family permease [Pseudoalteromonas sp. BDTF-M6]
MDAVFYVLIIAALFAALVLTHVRPATLFFSALLGCYALGYVDTATLLGNFTNTGLVSLVLLMLVSIALERTSLLQVLAKRIVSPSLKLSIIKVSTLTAAASAFLNNTAVVASLVGPLTRNKHHAPSKLLIPLSYAAILGGTTTLVGTSTNLIVNSFTQQYDDLSLAMFSFLPIGLAVTLVGVLLLIFCHKLLPDYPRVEGEHKEYLLEAKVNTDSPLIGKSIEKNGLRDLDDLFLVEIVREKRLISPVRPQNKIRAGDKLIFTGNVQSVTALQRIPGITLFADSNGLLSSNLQEVIVTHTSTLVGQTLKDVGFRAKFDAAVVAIHRNRGRLSGKLGEVAIRPGDRLMLAVGRDFQNRNNLDKNFYFVSEHSVAKAYNRVSEFALLGGFAAVIALAATALVPLVQGLLVFVALLLATKVLDGQELKRRFPFELVIIIASALGLANAFSGSGAELALQHWLGEHQGLTPFMALVLVYVLTVLLTELITNNAAAALMFPLAYGLASSLEVSLMPFAMTVAYGASAAFISPYSYQTNMIVMNAGQYRFADFARLGVLMSLAYAAVVLSLIGYVFEF